MTDPAAHSRWPTKRFLQIGDDLAYAFDFSLSETSYIYKGEKRGIGEISVFLNTLFILHQLIPRSSRKTSDTNYSFPFSPA